MQTPRRVLILTSVFPRVFGGRTKSLLQRARIFSSRGLDVTVISTNHDDDCQEVFDLYRDRGYVDDRIVLGNMFETMAGFDAASRGNVEVFIERVRALTSASVGGCDLGARVHNVEGGVGARKAIHIRFEGSSSTQATAIVNSAQNVTRLKVAGGAGELKYEDYLGRSLQPFLRYRKKDGKKTYAYLQEAARGPLKFISHKRVIADFLNGEVCEGDVVINDARGLDYPVRLIEAPVRKIYVMHNPHLADPLDAESGIKDSFKTILRNEGLKSNETIVSLTDDQRDSILSKVPALRNSISVIGHPSHVPRLRWRLRRRTRQVGIVGRLDSQKNLSDAILAFEAFRRAFPDYRMVIYGRGHEEGALRAMVRERGMEDAVRFMGFTHDVDAAFQSVDFTLNTSFFEGFPLAIVESISNGVPVASYPVNFGPGAILGGGAGRISAKRTPESLAVEMAALALHAVGRRKVQRLSRRFSVDDYFLKWVELLNKK